MVRVVIKNKFYSCDITTTSAKALRLLKAANEYIRAKAPQSKVRIKTFKL